MKKWNVGWGFTKLCNFTCAHCYNSSGVRSPEELNLEQAKAVVDKLAENNVETINYGTGECGLAAEFWELIQYVHSKGIIQGLTTNGSSVNPHTIQWIKERMNDVDVSIDYPNFEEHNKFRKHPNAWKWAVNALDLLKASDVPFSIVTCLHAKNTDKDTIADFLTLSKKYGCEWRINWFRPTGRGKDNEELKLDPKDVFKVFSFIVQNADIKALPDPYFAALLGLNQQKGCPCGKRSFRITPNGAVVPCVYFTGEIKNCTIQDNSFQTVVRSAPFEDINNRKIPFCASCEYRKTCGGGCASRAYLENGSLDAPDAFCFKKAGLRENPFKNLAYDCVKEAPKVHDNYLCTAIFKAR